MQTLRSLLRRIQDPGHCGRRAAILECSGSRQLRSLEQDWRDRGEHRTAWDRLDARGDRVARGIYVVRLVAGTTSVTRKVVLVRQ